MQFTFKAVKQQTEVAINEVLPHAVHVSSIKLNNYIDAKMCWMTLPNQAEVKAFIASEGILLSECKAIIVETVEQMTTGMSQSKAARILTLANALLDSGAKSISSEYPIADLEAHFLSVLSNIPTMIRNSSARTRSISYASGLAITMGRDALAAVTGIDAAVDLSLPFAAE
jgi:hypothetical protein